MKTNQCEGCVYKFKITTTKKGNPKRGCRAFMKIPPECWNNTTPEQSARREREIKLYSLTHGG